jgi:hypothetical protein
LRPQKAGSLVDSPTGDVISLDQFRHRRRRDLYCLVKLAGPAFRSNANRIQAAIAEGTRAREAAEQSPPRRGGKTGRSGRGDCRDEGGG